jgi:uncharacterized damage-inducible protein DinB
LLVRRRALPSGRGDGAADGFCREAAARRAVDPDYRPEADPIAVLQRQHRRHGRVANRRPVLTTEILDPHTDIVNQDARVAEATPAEKFTWRPQPGVRSISEVYMHIALGNDFLLRQAGVEGALDRSALPAIPEKAITDKAQVIDLMKRSFDAVRASYPKADRQKNVTFFGRTTTADGVFLRLLVHNHEHMGQAIAYARMNGIVPPWSKGGGE